MGQAWEDPIIKFELPRITKSGRVLPPANAFGQYKPNKGKKADRTRNNRLLKISQKVEEMPKMIEAYRKVISCYTSFALSPLLS